MTRTGKNLGVTALTSMILALSACTRDVDDVVGVADRVRPASNHTQSTAVAEGRQGPRLSDEVIADPFAELRSERPSAVPPPPSQPAPATLKPPPPATPPVVTTPPRPSFTLIGAIEPKGAGERPSAFLLDNGQVLVVRAGDFVGSQYRVDSVQEDRVELTYIPAAQKHLLLHTR